VLLVYTPRTIFYAPYTYIVPYLRVFVKQYFHVFLGGKYFVTIYDQKKNLTSLLEHATI